MIVIGIDVGKAGGIALLSPSYTSRLDVDLLVMPEDLGQVVAKLEWARDSSGGAHVFIERAQAMPKNGAVSMFNYGKGFGELLGVVCALGMPSTLIPPKTWSREMHVGTKGDTTKKRSIEAARRLFPNIKLTATDRCRKDHDGLAEALLIAEFGRRKLMAKAC